MSLNQKMRDGDEVCGESGDDEDGDYDEEN